MGDGKVSIKVPNYRKLQMIIAHNASEAEKYLPEQT